jgi:hypothetical protein
MKNSSPSEKSEPRPEFQEKPGDVPHEGVLDVALNGFLAEAEKLEHVGVLQGLDGELGVRRGEVAVEVGDRGAMAQVELVLDVNIQRGPRPAVPDDLGCIPFAVGVCGNLGEEGDDVEPGQLVSRLLTN